MARIDATGRVRAIAPPPESALAGWYAGADLVDAYAVALPPAAAGDVGALAERAFADPPAWIGGAMRLRDAVVGRLGIKTAAQVRAGLDASGEDHVHLFPVLSRADREIVIGLDDSHLDFRVSFQLRPAGRAEELVATTVVHCHNRLGRAYLATILPGHVMVMHSSLGRAARQSVTRRAGNDRQRPR